MSRSRNGGRSNFFFTAVTTKGTNGINNNNNGGVNNNGGRRRIYTNISALLYSEATGLWRASYSDHKDATNNRDYKEDTT